MTKSPGPWALLDRNLTTVREVLMREILESPDTKMVKPTPGIMRQTVAKLSTLSRKVDSSNS